MNKKKVIIYTDGACRGNPGPGGWGAYLVYGDKEKTISGSEAQTTNNRMELMAAIEALSMIKGKPAVCIVTDSTYLKNGITVWIARWRQNGWRTAQRKAVKNQDLWQCLDQLIETMNIEWVWVRGHTGQHGNETADRLARQAIDMLLAKAKVTPPMKKQAARQAYRSHQEQVTRRAQVAHQAQAVCQGRIEHQAQTKHQAQAVCQERIEHQAQTARQEHATHQAQAARQEHAAHQVRAAHQTPIARRARAAHQAHRSRRTPIARRARAAHQARVEPQAIDMLLAKPMSRRR